MEQSFWRVRLGAVGLFELCKKEKPPCIVIGWGKIDLGKSFDEIETQYEKAWGQLEGHELGNIRRWVTMKKGDAIIALEPSGKLCAIGEIISERPYQKKDIKFEMQIALDTDPHIALLYNRVDVKWITDPKNNMKVKDTKLPKHLKNKLVIPRLIQEFKPTEYNRIKQEMTDISFK